MNANFLFDVINKTILNLLTIKWNEMFAFTLGNLGTTLGLILSEILSFRHTTK